MRLGRRETKVCERLVHLISDPHRLGNQYSPLMTRISRVYPLLLGLCLEHGVQEKRLAIRFRHAEVATTKLSIRELYRVHKTDASLNSELTALHTSPCCFCCTHQHAWRPDQRPPRRMQ
jgi:hypothetical protein